MDQLQVLGLFQRLVAVRRLVTIGHDVAGQSREDILGINFARNRRHPVERAQRTRHIGHLFGISLGQSGFPRRRAQPGLAARCVISLDVLGCSSTVSRHQVQDNQLASHGRHPVTVARFLSGLEGLDIGRPGFRVTVPVQEVRILPQSFDVAGRTLSSGR